MFTPFHRKKVVEPPGLVANELSLDLTRPESAASLLATPRRKRLLENIWQRTSVSRVQFSSLYRRPIERYAELVQHFPASESHHHSVAGGMLNHALETIAYALKLRQSHLLPIGAPSENQAAQAEAWTAAIAYGALLHDVGKVAVHLHVEFADGNRWHPWHGKPAHPYRFRFRKDREYRLHGAAAGLLYTHVLDQAILDWLCGFPELWSALIYVLAGQFEYAGILGELVQQADQASVAQDLGGNPAKVHAAPKSALQRKLLDGLKHLLKEQLKLNQAQASDGWLTQDALWLVSKTVCDKLRAYLLSQGMDGVPSRNTDVFNVLQEHSIVQPTSDGKAIWRATVIGDNGWSNTFTFLRVAPALVWEMGERPESFGGMVRVDESGAAPMQETATNRVAAAILEHEERPTSIDSAVPPNHSTSTDSVDSLLSLLDVDNRSPAPSEQKSVTPEGSTNDEDVGNPSLITPPIRAPSELSIAPVLDDGSAGSQFMSWLRKGVQTRRLKINEARALVHTVAGTVFLVSPGIFQSYSKEFPRIALLAREAKVSDWEWAQKKFEHLHGHRKQPNGLNIWTCVVTGPRKSRQLHGYLLKDGSAVLPEIPFDNPHLQLRETGERSP